MGIFLIHSWIFHNSFECIFSKNFIITPTDKTPGSWLAVVYLLFGYINNYFTWCVIQWRTSSCTSSLSHTYDSLNKLYKLLFIYQRKKRSRSWRAGCHNGCTCYDSGVVRYWIVCWIGWHFVITLFQIWDKNDVIMIYNDVIIFFASSIKSDPWFSFSFYFYLHWMESPAYYPMTSFKKDLWLYEIWLIENFSWLAVMIIGCPDSISSVWDISNAQFLTSDDKKSYRKSNDRHIFHHQVSNIAFLLTLRKISKYRIHQIIFLP